MANTLRFKRGLASGIPTGVAGEPLFTTDTFDLYIGNGSGNTRFQKYIASGATSQILRGDGSLYTFPLAISSPTTGQVLKYNGTSWVNDSDSGITGSGSAGQVSYFTGATTQAGSNNLFWDNTNGRLGIGTNIPVGNLDVRGSANPQARVSDGTITTKMQSVTSLAAYIGTESNHQLRLITNNTPQITIFGGGNVHVGGTSDVGLKFMVTGNGYFSDSVGIGSTSLTGYNLRISKNITGSVNSYGVASDGAIQSGVTSLSAYFATYANTQSANFTLTDLRHYSTFAQTTFSNVAAGGAITTQYGFFVDQSLVGATNNYGFYGNIGAATGRWNLYMNGSANNYLNGDTSVGTTTMRGKFQVKLGVATAVSTIASSGFDNTYALFGNPDTTSGQCFGIGAQRSLDGINLISVNPTSDWVDTNYYSRQHIFYGTGTEGMRLTTLRNLHIGTFSSDSGEKLQVTGTMKVTGASSFGDTLSVNGSGSFVYAATCTATAKVGSASAGGSFMVLTPSVNSGFNSGFAVDGVYNAGKSEINLSAFGAKSGGPYSADMVFKTSSATTLSEKMRLDSSGNLGLSVIPSAWNFQARAIQVGLYGALSSRTLGSGTYLSSNVYFSGEPSDTAANANYIATGPTVGAYMIAGNTHKWFNAAAGTAGNAITFTQAMTLTALNNLLVGSTTDSGEKLQVTGTAKITGNLIAKSNLYTGASEVLVTSNGVLSESEVIQIYNGVAASTNIDKIADLILANNTSFTDGVIGRVIGVNGNLTSADKRIAQISMYLDGATNNGAIGFSTMSSGTISTKMILSASGNLAVDTNTLFVDATNNRVGIGTTSTNSTLHIEGSVSKQIVAKTANYTATASDHTILCDTTSGGFTITLPTATTCEGRIYVIKKVIGNSGLNNVTIDGNGSETIDGGATLTLQCKSSVMIQSDGANWYILSLYSDTSCL